jgi:hypothetical protein
MPPALVDGRICCHGSIASHAAALVERLVIADGFAILSRYSTALVSVPASVAAESVSPYLAPCVIHLTVLKRSERHHIVHSQQSTINDGEQRE